MMQYEREAGPPSITRWATGGASFAATIMVLAGVFEAIGGLGAIIDGGFFVVTANYAYDLDVAVWGWIHLAIGAFVALAGFSLFARKAWAGVVAIVLAMVSALANFYYIPYYPAWSLLLIALAVWVIWAPTRPGALRA